MSKFNRVDLEHVLRANSDDMPIFRKCFEHETLMSFYDDDGNEAFNQWWKNEGSELFYEYLKNNEEYYWLVRANDRSKND
jgi:hypothetical protein